MSQHLWQWLGMAFMLIKEERNCQIWSLVILMLWLMMMKVLITERCMETLQEPDTAVVLVIADHVVLQSVLIVDV